MAAISGNDQITAPGHRALEPLEVRVSDSSGSPISGAPVSFTVISGGGSIENGSAVTGREGIASSGAWTLGPDLGVQRVSAESGGASVIFSALASPPPNGPVGDLVFVSNRDGNPEIYAIEADGTALTRLTTSPGLDDSPAWSPDGRLIALVSDRDGTPGVYVMSADGSHVIPRAPGGFDPAWSPEGSSIAFSRLQSHSAAIVRVGIADDAIALLFDYPGYDAQPSWSPDGRQLVFVSDYAAYDFVLNIYTMNADGTEPQLRTPGFGFWPDLPYYLHPVWSPDGGMIAFVYGMLVNVPPGRQGDLTAHDMRFKVAVMSADGGFRKDLAWAGDIPWTGLLDPGSLAWSPDGLGVAYTFLDCDLVTRTGCSNRRSVRYVSLDGAQTRTIVENARNPSWRR